MESPIDQIDLSVVMITLNEGACLRRCFESLPKGIQLVVVDSGSSDNTEDICKEFGAEFYTRPFDNYSSQKNHALSYAKRKWVLSLDADEILDDQMTSTILGVVRSDPKNQAFRLRRSLVFLGRKMRYGKTSDYPIRLFRKGSARFEGEIHERLVFESSVTTEILATGYLWHYSYDDLSDYFTKFNEYTTKIAAGHQLHRSSAPSVLKLSARPWTEFLYRYIIRLGFLDGYPGYCYALISSFYSFIKYAKLKEMNTTNLVGELNDR